MELETPHVIYDTGTSLTYLPQKEYDQFSAKLNAAGYCYQEYSDLYCDCENAAYPTLNFMVGHHEDGERHWVKMKPSDYLMYYGYDLCYVLI